MSLSPASILYDSSGNEKGITGNPVKIDPTGTTAQPVTDNGGSLTVDGTVNVGNLPAVQPVNDNGGSLTIDATSLPLPTGAATETTLSTRLADSTFTARVNTLGQKTMANSTPVVFASDQSPLVVTQANPTAQALCISYDSTVAVAGAQANYWFAAATYTVPTGYRFSIGQYNSYSSDNRVAARVSKLKKLADWNPTSFALTNTASYTTPIFASFIELEVVSTMGGANDQVVTITYTNHLGTSGRTATDALGLKLKKNTPAGYKLLFALQQGDIGVLSIQSVTADVTNTGSVRVNGGIDLYWQDMPVSAENYIVVPSAANPVIIAGDQINLDFTSTAAATSRRLIKCIGTLETV
jgi:hypothetical protein